MKFAESNLNNYIKVKLTEYGRKIYRSSFVTLGLPEPRINIDEDGYTRFQIHDFVHVFGKYVCIGNDLPCEPNIQIEVKEESLKSK